MSETEYQEIMWAEMKPDVYSGEHCDEIAPQWETYIDGDMESNTMSDPIILDCKGFPPGAKIVISLPCCPECGYQVELCQQNQDCNFDWENWAKTQYS